MTITGSHGFSGDVDLSAAITDAGSQAISGWTVDFVPAKVTLSANGTATAVATLNIPAQNTGLAGTVKITGASSATAGTNNAAVAVTAVNQVTFAVKPDSATNKCTYTADAGTQAAPVTISQGTKVRFFNAGNENMIVHGQGAIPHESTTGTGTAPGQAYEVTLSTAGTTGLWYCHSPATDLSALNPHISVK